MKKVLLSNNLYSEIKELGVFPTDLVLYINSSCNLRCKHCYVGNDLLDSNIQYDTASIVKFLNDFEELERVTVLGGEPFLHPGLEEVLSALLRFTEAEKRMTTNLTQLRASVLEVVQRAGMRLCVSLDGHDRATHDKVRGGGAFDATVENLIALVEQGLDIEVTHTLTSENIDSFESLLGLCFELGIVRLNLHRTSLRGNALLNRNLDVAPTRWRKLVDWLEERGSEVQTGSEQEVFVRYEVGFATDKEYRDLVDGGYSHHAQGSYYSNKGGQRIVVYPDQKLYVSSEAFGGDAFIGEFKNGCLNVNQNRVNELFASESSGFELSSLNSELNGDEFFRHVLSVSYRRGRYVSR